MHAKEFHKLWKCSCSNCHCLHDLILSWVPHFSAQISSLMRGAWLGMTCSVFGITPWPYLLLAVLQPGLRAQHHKACGIFLKGIMQMEVPSCFLETAPGHPPWGQVCIRWWVCQPLSSSSRCWTSVRAHECVMRGLVAWGKMGSNPTSGSFIHSFNKDEFSIYY